MSRKIIVYPNPILLKKAEEIKQITPQVKNLAGEMIKALFANKGMGLAAPQIGVSKRIILMRSGTILINPVIIEESGEQTSVEGCLSIPELEVSVKRAFCVRVEALDIFGKEIVVKKDGIPAIILQHEIDHLDGILINTK